jgi:uncharacterized protein involved in exopolysaccharide biosynthesis
MDIARHVAAVAKRGSLIAVIAGVAGAITVAIAVLQPQLYRATADVVVPVPETSTSRIAAVSQTVSDFQGAIRSSVVAQRVANQTGVPAGAVLSRLRTEQLAGGAVVEVTFASSDRFTAREVVDAASTEALSILMQGQLAPVTRLHENAEASVERVSQEYQLFLTSNDLVDPERYFAEQTKRTNDMIDQINGLRSEGKLDEADQLQADLDTRVANLAPLQVQYRVLQQTLTGAVTAEREASSRLVSAQAAVEAVDDPATVPVSDPVAVSRLGQILRRLLVAVVVATALGIGLVILLELTTSPVARPRAVSADGGQTQRDGTADAAAPPSQRPVAAGGGDGRSSKRSRSRARSGNRR